MLRIKYTLLRLPLLSLLFVLGLQALLQADTIFLKDGRKLEGKVTSEQGDFVEIEIT